jgi:hypothetical protein
MISSAKGHAHHAPPATHWHFGLFPQYYDLLALYSDSKSFDCDLSLFLIVSRSKMLFITRNFRLALGKFGNTSNLDHGLL